VSVQDNHAKNPHDPTAENAAAPRAYDISLIICTRNRAASLAETLHSVADAVAAAPSLHIELIAVDNGSSDDTFDRLEAFAREAAFAVHVVQEHKPGLSNARNAGIARARAPLLAFTDDDCRLTPSYFEDVTREFATSPDLALLGGRVLLGDPSDIEFTIKPNMAPQKMTAATHPGVIVLGCNMIVRRPLLDQVGVFDPLFGAGAPFIASEETDLIYRAHRAGFGVEYRPAPTVLHYHGRKSQEDVKKLAFGYFVGNGALYAKHWYGGHWMARSFFLAAKDVVKKLVRWPTRSQSPFAPATEVAGTFKGIELYWRYKMRASARGSDEQPHDQARK
jgi:GT2 family glycosyltransferase